MRNFNKITVLLLNLVAVTTLSACTNVYEKEVAVIESVSDEDITDRVAYNILHDPALSTFDISVSTLRNEVQLCGFVDSSAARTKAERVTLRVPGVIAVKNNLIIRHKGEASTRYIKKY